MNIIVTGASRGIGRALVKEFAEQSGHTIIAISRNAEKLMQLAAECKKENYPSQVFPVAFDLGGDAYSFELLPGVLEHIDRVDILVNNAGLLVKKPFEELTDNDFDDVFRVNVKAVFKLSRALLPHFNMPAHIVNISSMGGVQGSAKFPGLTLYSAAKGAVAVLTEAMAEELKNKGISVNCLAFGAVQTEMLEMAFPGYKAPLEAEEMAAYVAEFALQGHKFFNGKVLPVSASTP